MYLLLEMVVAGMWIALRGSQLYHGVCDWVLGCGFAILLSISAVLDTAAAAELCSVLLGHADAEQHRSWCRS